MSRLFLVLPLVFIACEQTAPGYVASPQEIESNYRARFDEAIRQASAAVVWPSCSDEHMPEGSKCGMLTEQFLKPEQVNAFRAHACKESPDDPVTERCRSLFIDRVYTKFHERYPNAADPDVDKRCAAVDDQCASLASYEFQILRSHNDAVWSRERRAADEIEADLQKTLAHVEKQRASNEAREDEERRNREIMQGIAASLKGFGESFRRTDVVLVKACSTDFDCGAGAACAKSPSLSDGVCVRK